MTTNRLTITLLSIALSVFMMAPAVALVQIETPCPDPIPGSYIVVLDDSAVDPAKDARPGRDLATVSRSMAALYGGQVRHRYGHPIPGFSIQSDEFAVARLARDPRVVRIERDCPVYVSTSTQSSAPWGLDRVDQSFRPTNGTYTYQETGAGVHVYVIDTGISPSSSQFGSRLKSGKNVVSDNSVTTDEWGDPSDPLNDNGHGTGVASIIGGNTYGIAKGVFLYPVRIFETTVSSATSNAIAGVQWVIDKQKNLKNPPAVANMSFEVADSQTFTDKVNAAINAGIVMVAAANNDSKDACLTTPAQIPGVITVGATDSQDRRATFSWGKTSNWGPCLDLWAPGRDVPALHKDGSSMYLAEGTSFAAPHVTGAAALYRQSNPTHPVATVANYISQHATTGVLQGPIGTGSPKKLLFAKPAHACVSWSCNPSTRTCTFDLSCSRVPNNLGYYSLDFGDGTSYWGGSTTVTHTYPSQSIYGISLTLVPWQAQSPSAVTACVNTSFLGAGGCSHSDLVPWE